MTSQGGRPDHSRNSRRLEEFEKQWRDGERPDFELFLQGATNELRHHMLIDLIELDLGFQWKQYQIATAATITSLSDATTKPEAPSLTSYIREFPELGSVAELPHRLIVRQFRARQRWGDQVAVADFIAAHRLCDENLLDQLHGVVAPGEEMEVPKLPGYDQITPLGHGGMGIVYRARQKRMNRPVAIKLIPRHLRNDHAQQRRFEREMQAAAALNHPNVVSAYHADEADGRLFLVTELVDGSDLAKLIRETGAFEVDRAISVIRQVAEGLAYAHRHGVIHRDIKPSNLMLDLKANRARILDFGLARFTGDRVAANPAEESDELTLTGTVMGTVDYMAPEQAIDTRAADERSDIYSLGCVLHCLLSGRPPYGGSSLATRIMAHRDTPVPSVRETRPEIPEWVETVLHRMMAKQPEDRYQSMDELLDTLQAHQTVKAAQSDAVTIEQHRHPPAMSTGTVKGIASRAAVGAVVMLVLAAVAIGWFAWASWQTDASAPSLASGSGTDAAVRNAASVDAAPPDGPLDLDQWLAGRSVLTVAQDRDADFATIQAAIDALEPGGVVRVLDRGPYTEVIRHVDFPADTGLVTTAATVIRLTEWQENSQRPGHFDGHVIVRVHGFRLSGFVFVTDEQLASADHFKIVDCRDVTVDDCIFLRPKTLATSESPIAFSDLSILNAETVRVSECACGSGLRIYAAESSHTQVERNWFREPHSKQLLITSSGEATPDRPVTVDVRNNIFEPTGDIGLYCNIAPHFSAALTIENNTFRGAENADIGFFSDVSDEAVTIRRNLFLGASRLISFFGIEANYERIVSGWDVTENCCAEHPERLKLYSDPPAEVVAIDSILSGTPTDRNYLRLRAEHTAPSGLAQSNVPTYVGALRPGRVDDDGDWFTRLQSRWNEQQ